MHLRPLPWCLLPWSLPLQLLSLLLYLQPSLPVLLLPLCCLNRMQQEMLSLLPQALQKQFC